MIHKPARPAEKVVAKEKLSLVVVVVVGSECVVRLRERGNKIRNVFSSSWYNCRGNVIYENH